MRGEQVYQDECTFCHLDDLMGDAFATPLVADAFTFRWDGSSVGDLMTVIQVTMPADRPQTLSDEAVADVIAFLLKMNEYPTGDEEAGGRPDRAGEHRHRRRAGAVGAPPCATTVPAIGGLEICKLNSGPTRAAAWRGRARSARSRQRPAARRSTVSRR